MDQRNCPIRGKCCIINIRKKANANEVIAAGLSKFHAHDRQALLTNVSLHYPDGSFVSTLPEGDELFCISAYKGQLMKDYQKIIRDNCRMRKRTSTKIYRHGQGLTL